MITGIDNNQGRRRTDLTMACELIAFRMGTQEFCVDIMSVREIRGWTKVTALPKSQVSFAALSICEAPCCRSWIWPRDWDFRRAEPTARHVIIVAQIGAQIVGLLVDAVSDILTVTGDLIQPTPDVASDMAKSFVRGVLAVDQRMISLIALDQVLPVCEQDAA